MLSYFQLAACFDFDVTESFLVSVETDENVTQPVVEAINSTAIGVYLPSVPFLPPRDNWTYAAQQEVIYYRTGYIAEEQAVTVIGAPPRTIPVTNLLYNTEYTIYLRYFGTVRGAVHKINTNSVTAKTREECALYNIFYQRYDLKAWSHLGEIC